jgi:hypothetical protein
VPVSDLFDALVAGDEPLTGELGALWKSAQKVHGEIRHEIRRGYGLSGEQADTAPATHAVRRDDRIAKTLVLGALLPQVEALRDLTARKVVALNTGFIRSMVPGQESTNASPTGGRSNAGWRCCGWCAPGPPGSAPCSSPATTPTRC